MSEQPTMVPPYYRTECEHRVTSYHPVTCVHGSLTAVPGQPFGQAYSSSLVHVPESTTDTKGTP